VQDTVPTAFLYGIIDNRAYNRKSYMPIFEYKCSKCGFVNEVLVKSASSKGPACPECGEKKVKKQFSSFAAVVKDPPAAASKCQACPSAGGCPNFNA
jgi:putative FmdB family regulatory protein